MKACRTTWRRGEPTLRRCSIAACALRRCRSVVTPDGILMMTWYQCTACDAWIAVDPANDAPTAVAVEQRAADIAQWADDRQLVRYSEIAEVCNGGEIAGWLTYVAASMKEALGADEGAGYLAAAIYLHEVELTPIRYRETT